MKIKQVMLVGFVMSTSAMVLFDVVMSFVKWDIAWYGIGDFRFDFAVVALFTFLVSPIAALFTNN